MSSKEKFAASRIMIEVVSSGARQSERTGIAHEIDRSQDNKRSPLEINSIKESMTHKSF